MDENNYHMELTCIVLDEIDNVATLLKNVKEGEKVVFTKGNQSHELAVLNSIHFGHKVAISHISAGEEVRKYGETIGVSTAFIRPGEHVHIHNIDGIRGRGDKSEGRKRG